MNALLVFSMVYVGLHLTCCKLSYVGLFVGGSNSMANITMLLFLSTDFLQTLMMALIFG